jgi:protein-disulfide isomerase
VTVVTTSGEQKKQEMGSGTQASEAIATVDSLLAGIPQHGNVLGNSKAPVTLQYFGDLECPSCKEFSVGVLPSIIDNWVRTGELRIQYRSIESATRERRTFVAQQLAAYAAGLQNRAWYFIELFYQEQGEEDTGYVTAAYLQKLGEQAKGLNLTQWYRDGSNPVLKRELAGDLRAAQHAGLRGTPEFLVGRTGTAMKKLEYTSLTDPTSFSEAIEHVLAHH